MLEAKNITLQVRQRNQPKTILNNISIGFEAAKMHALIGPSGCGKSTLIQSILRLNKASGEVTLNGHRINRSEDLAGNAGLVPQFSIAYEQLTVRQNLSYAKELFNGSKSVDEVCALVGLSLQAEQRVGILSGGQKRRLSLALELINNPAYLICDEVTSGLDPHSEAEILLLLKGLTASGITVICVIHNLNQLHFFDHIHILKDGSLTFEGSYPEMMETLQLASPAEVYTHLPSTPILYRQAHTLEQAHSVHTYDPAKQLKALLCRRFSLFFQDRGHLFLTCLLTFGFPFLVVIFAQNGIPQIESLSLEPNFNTLDRLRQELDYNKSQLQTGSLVSGIIIFQVILLALMGANNGAREIANEQNILKKEKFSGLNICSYIMSKLVFVLVLSAIQGVWMCLFVKYICHIPSSFFPQAAILTLTVFAMSTVSLCVSAFAHNAEKASLICTYLVGFQLPLSGIVLALPDTLIWVFRPFIASFWGWSGYVTTLRENRLYDTVLFALNQVPSAYALCVAVLLLHILLATALTLYRTYRLS